MGAFSLGKVQQIQGVSSARGNWVWVYHHLAQLLRRFHQIPISPGRIGQAVEHSKSKSTRPKSTSRWNTLYSLHTGSINKERNDSGTKLTFVFSLKKSNVMSERDKFYGCCALPSPRGHLMEICHLFRNCQIKYAL